jgi:hypothetical protein
MFSGMRKCPFPAQQLIPAIGDSVGLRGRCRVINAIFPSSTREHGIRLVAESTQLDERDLADKDKYSCDTFFFFCGEFIIVGKWPFVCAE